MITLPAIASIIPIACLLHIILSSSFLDGAVTLFVEILTLYGNVEFISIVLNKTCVKTNTVNDDNTDNTVTIYRYISRIQIN